MPTYRTKNGVQDGFIPSIGVIKDGKITTDQIIENPNLELVEDTKEPEVSTTPAQTVQPVVQSTTPIASTPASTTPQPIPTSKEN